MKNIQVFTKESDCAEVNGDLVGIVHKEGWTIVQYKDEIEDKVIWENRFPDWNISMIRISKV